MKTSLYRMYGADNQLLYVGISYKPIGRIGQHRDDKTWFDEIRHIELEWFDDREKALAAESYAILRESPVYNIIRPQKRRPIQTPDIAFGEVKVPTKPKEVESAPKTSAPKEAGIHYKDVIGPPKPCRKIAVVPKGVFLKEIEEGHYIHYTDDQITDGGNWPIPFLRLCLEAGDLVYVEGGDMAKHAILPVIREKRAYIFSPQQVVHLTKEDHKKEICRKWHNPQNDHNPSGYSRKTVMADAKCRLGDHIKEHHIKHWCGAKRGK